MGCATSAVPEQTAIGRREPPYSSLIIESPSPREVVKPIVWENSLKEKQRKALEELESIKASTESLKEQIFRSAIVRQPSYSFLLPNLSSWPIEPEPINKVMLGHHRSDIRLAVPSYPARMTTILSHSLNEEQEVLPPINHGQSLTAAVPNALEITHNSNRVRKSSHRKSKEKLNQMTNESSIAPQNETVAVAVKHPSFLPAILPPIQKSKETAPCVDSSDISSQQAPPSQDPTCSAPAETPKLDTNWPIINCSPRESGSLVKVQKKKMSKSEIFGHTTSVPETRATLQMSVNTKTLRRKHQESNESDLHTKHEAIMEETSGERQISVRGVNSYKHSISKTEKKYSEQCIANKKLPQVKISKESVTENLIATPMECEADQARSACSSAALNGVQIPNNINSQIPIGHACNPESLMHANQLSHPQSSAPCNQTHGPSPVQVLNLTCLVSDDQITNLGSLSCNQMRAPKTWVSSNQIHCTNRSHKQTQGLPDSRKLIPSHKGSTHFNQLQSSKSWESCKGRKRSEITTSPNQTQHLNRTNDQQGSLTVSMPSDQTHNLTPPMSHNKTPNQEMVVSSDKTQCPQNLVPCSSTQNSTNSEFPNLAQNPKIFMCHDQVTNPNSSNQLKSPESLMSYTQTPSLKSPMSCNQMLTPIVSASDKQIQNGESQISCNQGSSSNRLISCNQMPNSESPVSYDQTQSLNSSVSCNQMQTPIILGEVHTSTCSCNQTPNFKASVSHKQTPIAKASMSCNQMLGSKNVPSCNATQSANILKKVEKTKSCCSQLKNLKSVISPIQNSVVKSLASPNQVASQCCNRTQSSRSLMSQNQILCQQESASCHHQQILSPKTPMPSDPTQNLQNLMLCSQIQNVASSVSCNEIPSQKTLSSTQSACNQIRSPKKLALSNQALLKKSSVPCHRIQTPTRLASCNQIQNSKSLPSHSHISCIKYSASSNQIMSPVLSNAIQNMQTSVSVPCDQIKTCTTSVSCNETQKPKTLCQARGTASPCSQIKGSENLAPCNQILLCGKSSVPSNQPLTPTSSVSFNHIPNCKSAVFHRETHYPTNLGQIPGTTISCSQAHGLKGSMSCNEILLHQKSSVPCNQPSTPASSVPCNKIQNCKSLVCCNKTGNLETSSQAPGTSSLCNQMHNLKSSISCNQIPIQKNLVSFNETQKPNISSQVLCLKSSRSQTRSPKSSVSISNTPTLKDSPSCNQVPGWKASFNQTPASKTPSCSDQIQNSKSVTFSNQTKVPVKSCHQISNANNSPSCIQIKSLASCNRNQSPTSLSYSNQAPLPRIRSQVCDRPQNLESSVSCTRVQSQNQSLSQSCLQGQQKPNVEKDLSPIEVRISRRSAPIHETEYNQIMFKKEKLGLLPPVSPSNRPLKTKTSKSIKKCKSSDQPFLHCETCPPSCSSTSQLEGLKPKSSRVIEENAKQSSSCSHLLTRYRTLSPVENPPQIIEKLAPSAGKVPTSTLSLARSGVSNINGLGPVKQTTPDALCTRKTSLSSPSSEPPISKQEVPAVIVDCSTSAHSVKSSSSPKQIDEALTTNIGKNLCTTPSACQKLSGGDGPPVTPARSQTSCLRESPSRSTANVTESHSPSTTQHMCAPLAPTASACSQLSVGGTNGFWTPSPAFPESAASFSNSCPKKEQKAAVCINRQTMEREKDCTHPTPDTLKTELNEVTPICPIKINSTCADMLSELEEFQKAYVARLSSLTVTQANELCEETPVAAVVVDRCSAEVGFPFVTAEELEQILLDDSSESSQDLTESEKCQIENKDQVSELEQKSPQLPEFGCSPTRDADQVRPESQFSERDDSQFTPSVGVGAMNSMCTPTPNMPSNLSTGCSTLGNAQKSATPVEDDSGRSEEAPDESGQYSLLSEISEKSCERPTCADQRMKVTVSPSPSIGKRSNPATPRLGVLSPVQQRELSPSSASHLRTSASVNRRSQSPRELRNVMATSAPSGHAPSYVTAATSPIPNATDYPEELRKRPIANNLNPTADGFINVSCTPSSGQPMSSCLNDFTLEKVPASMLDDRAILHSPVSIRGVDLGCTKYGRIRSTNTYRQYVTLHSAKVILPCTDYHPLQCAAICNTEYEIASPLVTIETAKKCPDLTEKAVINKCVMVHPKKIPVYNCAVALHSADELTPCDLEYPWQKVAITCKVKIEQYPLITQCNRSQTQPTEGFELKEKCKERAKTIALNKAMEYTDLIELSAAIDISMCYRPHGLYAIALSSLVCVELGALRTRDGVRTYGKLLPSIKAQTPKTRDCVYKDDNDVDPRMQCIHRLSKSETDPCLTLGIIECKPAMALEEILPTATAIVKIEYHDRYKFAESAKTSYTPTHICLTDNTDERFWLVETSDVFGIQVGYLPPTVTDEPLVTKNRILHEVWDITPTIYRGPEDEKEKEEIEKNKIPEVLTSMSDLMSNFSKVKNVRSSSPTSIQCPPAPQQPTKLLNISENPKQEETSIKVPDLSAGDQKTSPSPLSFYVETTPIIITRSKVSDAKQDNSPTSLMAGDETAPTICQESSDELSANQSPAEVSNSAQSTEYAEANTSEMCAMTDLDVSPMPSELSSSTYTQAAEDDSCDN